MAVVKNTEALAERLTEATGENVTECGWGTLGVRNVLVGITPSALVLEFITVSYKTKELRRIPFEELELVHPAKGDASTPAFLKMNLQGAVGHAFSGTLLVKVQGEKLLNIIFNVMPRFADNHRAPFRIAEYLSALHPELLKAPDLADAREKFSMGGCLKLFAILTGVLSVVFALLMGFVNGWDEGAMIAGGGMGLLLAAVFAPLGHWLKRIISGRG